AGGVRRLAMTSLFGLVAGWPIGLALGQLGGEDAVPFLHQPAVGLEMELHAVAGAANAERLVVGGHVAGQPQAATRKGEGVVVPLEDGEMLRQAGEQRVGAALRCQLDVLPAEFAGRTEQVLTAIGPRQQLAAEADTQRCASGIDETAHQLEQLRKPWRTSSSNAFCPPPSTTRPS